MTQQDKENNTYSENWIIDTAPLMGKRYRGAGDSIILPVMGMALLVPPAWLLARWIRIFHETDGHQTRVEEFVPIFPSRAAGPLGEHAVRSGVRSGRGSGRCGRPVPTVRTAVVDCPRDARGRRVAVDVVRQVAVVRRLG